MDAIIVRREDANIKLDSVISEIMGKSGRAMLKELIAGERDPDKLAAQPVPLALIVSPTRTASSGLVGGQGFAVDASLIVADANKQRSIPAHEWSKDIDPELDGRAVKES